MQYIIMCGGKYHDLKTPKWLTEIKGEKLINRTIRLLHENGVNNIQITTNDMNVVLNDVDATRVFNENNFEVKSGKKIKGYWVNAFYPTDEETTYLYGDVYYSDEAIKKIVEAKTDYVLMFGSRDIKNNPLYFKEWEEPFAFKVVNQHNFRIAIEICKIKADEGVLRREPISWELYRVINNYPIDVHKIGKNYIPIDDYTTDIDNEEDVKKLEMVLDEIHGTHNT